RDPRGPHRPGEELRRGPGAPRRTDRVGCTRPRRRGDGHVPTSPRGPREEGQVVARGADRRPVPGGPYPARGHAPETGVGVDDVATGPGVAGPDRRVRVPGVQPAAGTG